MTVDPDEEDTLTTTVMCARYKPLHRPERVGCQSRSLGIPYEQPWDDAQNQELSGPYRRQKINTETEKFKVFSVDGVPATSSPDLLNSNGSMDLAIEAPYTALFLVQSLRWIPAHILRHE